MGLWHTRGSEILGVTPAKAGVHFQSDGFPLARE